MAPWKSPELALVSALQLCARSKDLARGSLLHALALLLRTGPPPLAERPRIACTLVSMYAKCGMMLSARRVIQSLPFQDAVSWSALISGYARSGQGDQAMECFSLMQAQGLSPNEFTFSCLLKACGATRASAKGREIHGQVACRGLLETTESTILANALLDMYAKCGSLRDARQVFESIPARDLVSWSSLIAGYAHRGQGHLALNVFEQMQAEGIAPNELTFSSILKACGSARDVARGEQIHDQIVDRGLFGSNLVLGNALVDMYAKCGALCKARRLLEELPVKDVVSWNAIITGYVQEEQGQEALCCFVRMRNEGFSPDEVTFICILGACGNTGAIVKGKQIHNEIVGGPSSAKTNILLATALIDMYAKCGEFVEAQEVLFKQMSHRDTVAWNALIAGYVQHERSQEALDCLASMKREGLSPNEVTFLCILKACGGIGAISKGEEVHEEILQQGLLQENIGLGTSLVDMYAKCGALAKARRVLEELPIRETVSWNALIAGYAQQGHWQEVVESFGQMQREGISPDEVTFLCLLNACSHSGKPDDAQIYYESMGMQYGIAPKVSHQACMVMVFGCAGRIEKAISLIKAMPHSDEPSSVWIALLGACTKWGNVELGRVIFDQAIQIDDSLAAPYILMANIYQEAGMHEDANKIGAMMHRRMERHQTCTMHK
jgi:pentatricopeptide repeat protein